MGSCLKKKAERENGMGTFLSTPGRAQWSNRTEPSGTHDYNTVLRNHVCVCVWSEGRRFKEKKILCFLPHSLWVKCLKQDRMGPEASPILFRKACNTPVPFNKLQVSVNKPPHFLISPNEMISNPHRHFLSNSHLKYYEHIQYVLITYTKMVFK